MADEATKRTLPTREREGAARKEDNPLSFSSRSIHADDGISAHSAVAPAMHVSTTFRYSEDPERLKPPSIEDAAALPADESYVYSRVTNPNTARLEAVLSSLVGGPSLTYSSGLAAFHAMLVHLNPKRIAIAGGYHGCHGVIDILSRLTGLVKVSLDDEEALAGLGAGDVIHVETPLNPTGEARNLEHFARRARERGAWLTVDATFAPPPLMDPFAFGADVVMHSGTKYFGGHSDLLCGVLSVAPKHEAWLGRMLKDRVYLGSVMGSFEGWLGMRSIRTLELRVRRQSSTATALAAWLDTELRRAGSEVSGVIEKVLHSSLQKEASEEGSWLQRQMPVGHGPVFALMAKNADMAKRLPSKLKLFHHATSLGGVESLIEWRAMSDPDVDLRLLRVSIGVEDLEDLKEDFQEAFRDISTWGKGEGITK